MQDNTVPALDDASARPIVTLTGEHRDAVCDCVRFELSDAGELMMEVRSGNAWELIQQITTCVRVLDALGWDDDLDRDAYELEVDPHIASLMRDVEQRTLANLQLGQTETLRLRGPVDEWDGARIQALQDIGRVATDRHLDALAATRLVAEAVA